MKEKMKTHKCPQIAKMQIQAGALGITCAKLGEAEVLVESGIQDILIANQVVGPPKIEHLCVLAPRADLKVAVDDATNVDELSRMASGRGTEVGVLVEVDETRAPPFSLLPARSRVSVVVALPFSLVLPCLRSSHADSASVAAFSCSADGSR